MSEHAEGHGGSTKQNLKIWVVLLVLTAVEVFLAYKQIDQVLMLILLMALSVVKAALIMAYFMHLKFERLSFVLTLVPATAITIVLLAVFYPDGFRAQHHSTPSTTPAPAHTSATPSEEANK